MNAGQGRQERYGIPELVKKGYRISRLLADNPGSRVLQEKMAM
jgi:hypothetical protein